MTTDAQARKLELVVRVAERVWGTAGAAHTEPAAASTCVQAGSTAHAPTESIRT